MAALFALHPLQVDTVAWVAERKNLLSAAFWLLTIWAYMRYVEIQRRGSKVQSPPLAFDLQPTRRGTPNTQHVITSFPSSSSPWA